MEYTPEQLRELYKNLPEDVREAMFAVDSADKIQEIGKKYKLHTDQVGELGKQVGFVMLGILTPRNFVQELTNKLNISPDLARQVAVNINAEIFTPIRESLKKIHQLYSTTNDKTKPVVPPVVPPPQDAPISLFAAKTAGPVVSTQQEALLTPADLINKPKKDFDPYREPIG